MAEQSVTLQPAESKQVSFEAIPHEARTYQVSVNELTGSFKAIGLLISFTNPYRRDVFSWTASLYDINTQTWQSPPSGYNPLDAVLSFTPTGDFLFYVSEHCTDFTTRHGPYLIEAPVLLGGNYDWNNTDAKLVGEYVIIGQSILDTENSCVITGTVSNVRVESRLKANFTVEEILSCNGLGAAQFFLGTTLLDVFIGMALDEGDNAIINSGDKITMTVYLIEGLKWHAIYPHYPLEYPAEYYQFSGSVEQVEFIPYYTHVIEFSVTSPYLSSFGVIVLQWDGARRKTDHSKRFIGPITDRYDIYRDHYIYVLAHPDPNQVFSNSWCRDQWKLNNWRYVVWDKA